MPKLAGLAVGAALLSAIGVQTLQATPLKTPAPSVALIGKSSAGAFNVFGSLELRTNKKGSLAKQWKRVVSRVRSEEPLYEACDRKLSKCHAKVRAWRRSIKQMGDLNGWNLLAAVNGKVNQLVRYADDIKQFGRIDHWASPIESLVGRGDCEDYVILKYFSLVELGVSEDDMRVVVVKDNKRRIGHAVLAVKLAGKTYILDSLRARPQLHTSIKRYSPYYSFNRNGNWINLAARKRTTKVASARPAKQTPEQARALLPDYARRIGKTSALTLRGAVSETSQIQ